MSPLEPAPRAFSDAEYAARADKVRTAMAAAGVDVLYVTNPANVIYLCGYEAVWYSPRLPLGVAVVREPAELVFFDWSRHQAYAELHSHCDDIVYFEYADAVDTVAATFAERGWTDASVALELAGTNPSGSTSMALWAAMEERASTLVSGDWLVDGIRAFKSPAEVTKIRAAGVMADQAMAALRTQLRPGMTELQVSARLHSLLADAGSEIASTQPLVSSGPTAWLDTHAFPSNRRLEVGDIVTIDCCGVVDRYHANLCRTFSIGEADPAAVALLNVGRLAVEEFCTQAKVGERPERAINAANELARTMVPAEKVWWIGGYGLGIGVPPSWVGHTYLDNSGPQQIDLAPGYVSNFETILVSEDDGFEAGSIDTIVVTDDAVEVLSTIPREMQVVEV